MKFGAQLTTVLLFMLLAADRRMSASDELLNNAEKRAGFVSMFNGKDFSGWRFTRDKAADTVTNWKVEDGLIRLSGGGNPHLVTQREYADFEMIFEWRGMRDKYNSGFYIRTPKNAGKNQINLAKGGEGQFIGGRIEGAKPVPGLQKPAKQWNEWRVLVKGPDVTFWCNGKLAWKATGLKPEKGFIALQAEGAPLDFRKLRIRELK